jgi:ribosomal protein S18 acetylase RimI-like enzyme
MSAHRVSVPELALRRAITLRAATDQDEPFLSHLYKLSRVEEFSMTGISEAHFDILMRMQYSARRAAYESNYPDAIRYIVNADGRDAGQIWVFSDTTQCRVIDIAIAAEFQNQGIGAVLMTDFIAQARQAGVPLRCSVATNNPGSLRFHQRLGFRIVSSDEAYHEMEYESDADTSVGLN